MSDPTKSKRLRLRWNLREKVEGSPARLDN
jgi:hypothetical protein